MKSKGVIQGYKIVALYFELFKTKYKKISQI